MLNADRSKTIGVQRRLDQQGRTFGSDIVLKCRQDTGAIELDHVDVRGRGSLHKGDREVAIVVLLNQLAERNAPCIGGDFQKLCHGTHGEAVLGKCLGRLDGRGGNRKGEGGCQKQSSK